MYFIHLEREDKGDGTFTPLSLEEWVQLVEEDPEMEYSNTTTYISEFGRPVTMSGGFYGIWKPQELKGRVVHFWFEDGVVTTLYDPYTLFKLSEFARKIDGFIYGDLGEKY